MNAKIKDGGRDREGVFGMYKFNYCYDESENAITITEGTSVITWSGVNKETFDEMAKLYLNLDKASVFLSERKCRRGRGDGGLA